MYKLIIILMLTLALISCQEKTTDIQSIKLDEGEVAWAGVIRDGHLMPFLENYEMDFADDNKGNQLQPVILTSSGRYIWSEEPFKFEMKENELIISDPFKSVITGSAGTTLAEAHSFIIDKFMSPTGTLPDTFLFTAPQYNTWIELNFNQNQVDILKYAQAIIDNGLPPGVFMIDDTWQEDFGIWDFHPGRFSDPKMMVKQLQDMGFKVMLWICPFVSADQAVLYRDLSRQKALLLERNSPDDTWETARNPAMIRWWNGVSAVLDFSNPTAVDWFNAQLDRLVEDYGVDGFKLDAGDFRFYPENTISKMNYSPNDHCYSFAQFGLRFPLNEYRACWKMGNQPLAQRLHDKGHSWDELQQLIPNMVVAGLSGYTFSCPDMIGGGLLSTFEDNALINQELVVRSAQCHALMPMMQFSVAPWRILDKVHFEAVKEAVALREIFVPEIMKLANESSNTGKPIMTNLEYYFPNMGYAAILDQFMLGPDIMVAPVVAAGNKRKVIIPPGSWKGDDNVVYEGGKEYETEVPLNRLPYYLRLKDQD